MKKYLLLLLTLLSALPALCETTEVRVGSLYYKCYDYSYSSYAEVVANESYKELSVVTIPASISANGTTYPVTDIGSSAFQDCQNLTKVTFPASLTAIYTSAFKNCTSLTSVVIPDNVTNINSSAFANCTALQALTLPNNASYTASYASIISGCTALKELTIPDKITKLSNNILNGSFVETIHVGKSYNNDEGGVLRHSTLTNIDIDPANENFYTADGGLYWKRPYYAMFSLYRVCSLPESGILRLAENTGVFKNALDGLDIAELILPESQTTVTLLSYYGIGTRIGKLTIPARITAMYGSYQSPAIGKVVIEESDTPLNLYYDNDNLAAAFTRVQIDTLIVNRDILNTKYSTKLNRYFPDVDQANAFYQASLGYVALNVSQSQSDQMFRYNNGIKTLEIGPDVRHLGTLESNSSTTILQPNTIIECTDLSKCFTTSPIYTQAHLVNEYKSSLPSHEIFPIVSSCRIWINAFDKTLNPGDNAQLTAMSTPENATINWESDNQAVATVDNTGKVTAVSDGITFISATLSDYPSVTSKMMVKVDSEAVTTSEYAYLTVKNAETHSMTHHYAAGTEARIAVVLEAGWHVHSLTFNDEDMTDQINGNEFITPALTGDNTLNLVMASDISTSASQLDADSRSIGIHTNADSVTITGLENGETIQIYDLDGHMIYNGTETTVILGQHKVYLLHTAGRTFKFTL